MANYKISINTENYEDMKCSKRNWEPGTINNYMEALNSWKTTAKNLQEVRWQIDLFAGRTPKDWWDKELDEVNPVYEVWKNKKKNTIKYKDKLCGFERQQLVEGYGFKQGYFDMDEAIAMLKKDGSVQIPFKWLYDIRQYSKNMEGCYMLIESSYRRSKNAHN